MKQLKIRYTPSSGQELTIVSHNILIKSKNGKSWIEQYYAYLSELEIRQKGGSGRGYGLKSF